MKSSTSLNYPSSHLITCFLPSLPLATKSWLAPPKQLCMVKWPCVTPWNLRMSTLSLRSHRCTPWVATLRSASLSELSIVNAITGWSSCRLKYQGQKCSRLWWNVHIYKDSNVFFFFLLSAWYRFHYANSVIDDLFLPITLKYDIVRCHSNICLKNFNTKAKSHSPFVFLELLGARDFPFDLQIAIRQIFKIVVANAVMCVCS